MPNSASVLQNLTPVLPQTLQQAGPLAPLPGTVGTSEPTTNSGSANSNTLIPVSQFTQPVLPTMFRADNPDHLAGVWVMRANPKSDFAAELIKPKVFSAKDADYSADSDSRIHLRSGELLVSMRGLSGTGMVVTSSGQTILIRKSADALIATSNGVTRVQNLSGPPRSVIVDPPGEEDPISIGLGREVVTGTTTLRTADVAPQDNVARRNTVIVGNGQLAVSEIYLPSALKNNLLITGLIEGADSAEHLLGSTLIKAAAVQALVRGVEGFSFSTVNEITSNVVLRAEPLPPVPPEVPSAVSPPPPVATPITPTAPAPSGTAPTAATLAQQSSTVGATPSFPQDQTLQSIRNNLKPVPGSLPPGQIAQTISPPPAIIHPILPPITPPPVGASPDAARHSKASSTVPAAPTTTTNGPAGESAPLSHHGQPAESGVELREVPQVIGEEIKKHPGITAALIALIAGMLMMTTFFWRSARIRAKMLAAVNLELTLARDRALDASRTKSEFLANISHEIRTPITIVLGTSRMLLDMQPTSEQRELLNTLGYSAHALLETVGGILDFSKIEADKLNLEAVPFSPRAVLQEVSDSMTSLAHAKNLSFSMTIDASVPNRVIADPARLKQILTNLVSNAIKFTSEGSIAIVASASPATENRATLNVSVKDTGLGISDADRGKIFEPFVQADASTTRRFGGTGLGLTISKRLAKLMGGDIDFTSIPGSGSEFLLTLPVQAAPEVSPRVNAELAAGGSVTGRRLLVADDSPVLQKIVKGQLEKLGYQVDVVSDGQQALDAARSGQYGLIFMDWQMPVMDGLSATKAIRALDSEHGGMPIIAMTANAMEGDRTSCMQAGMSDYVSKPFSKEQLKSLLDYWLS